MLNYQRVDETPMKCSIFSIAMLDLHIVVGTCLLVFPGNFPLNGKFLKELKISSKLSLHQHPLFVAWHQGSWVS